MHSRVGRLPRYPRIEFRAVLHAGRTAFEIGGIDEAARTGWSVIVDGVTAEVTTPTEIGRPERLRLQPWPPSKPHLVRPRQDGFRPADRAARGPAARQVPGVSARGGLTRPLTQPAGHCGWRAPRDQVYLHGGIHTPREDGTADQVSAPVENSPLSAG
jgi:hypothetical protein